MKDLAFLFSSHNFFLTRFSFSLFYSWLPPSRHPGWWEDYCWEKTWAPGWKWVLGHTFVRENQESKLGIGYFFLIENRIDFLLLEIIVVGLVVIGRVDEEVLVIGAERRLKLNFDQVLQIHKALYLKIMIYKNNTFDRFWFHEAMH